MTHATRARKERGAKIVAVDVYMNGTMEQADLPVLVKPGTDGALACAVMHCLFRDGKADWDYLDNYTDAPRELEAHVRTRDSAMGVAPSPARRSRRSRNSPGSSARPSAPSSASATASRARATARPTCTRQAASRRSPAPGSTKAAAPSTSTPTSTTGQDDDRRPRRARPLGAHARPVAHRRDPDRRRRGAARRAAGDGDADPEHQSGVGRARSEQGEARLCARGPVRLRARAVHDRDGADGRRRAAGDDVPGARRHLSGRRPPISSSSGRS